MDLSFSGPAAGLTPPSVPATVLAVRDLQHRYGSFTSIQALSFTLAQGDIGCLLGPSGCGKTTALRAIAGFERIAAGSIAIGGQIASEPGRTTPPEARRIGMVFQDYALFPHLTVAENVGFGLRHLKPGERTARVTAMLALTGMRHSPAKYPHELSGGQQQRVALARALGAAPHLLLLDEPFSNLDTELREKLSLEVRDIIKQSGATALLVTHDQHEAFAMADRIGVMERGVLQQWDTAYNLYHRPGNRFVADFIGQGAFVSGVVHARHSEDERAAQHIHVNLGDLHGELVDPHARAVGTEVEVLLRPDDVVHDDASAVQAEVLRKAFRGAEFLYTLKLDSGDEVLALVPSHHNHSVGERIGIRLEVDHVVAFAKTSVGTGADLATT